MSEKNIVQDQRWTTPVVDINIGQDHRCTTAPVVDIKIGQDQRWTTAPVEDINKGQD